MKSTLQIADIPITLETDIKWSHRKLNTFKLRSSGEEMKLTYRLDKEIQVPKELIVFDDSIRWVPYTREAKKTELYLFNRMTDSLSYRMTADRDWSQVDISYTPEEKKPAASFLSTLGEIAFRNRILRHNGLVIHGAAIEYEGKGLIFSGPSGMGKTTQANLWRKYKGAVMINHDRPAIRVIQGGPRVYGTLWNGASRKCTNKTADLSAIVLLEQSKENDIMKLTGEETLKKLMPRSFLPYNNEQDMKLALKNLEDIIAVTPVFLLRCRPDREAVELLYQCMK